MTRDASCPGRLVLVAYSLAKLEESAAALVEEHIEHCPNCERVLDSLESQPDSVLDALQRRSAGTSEASDQANFLTVPENSDVEEDGPEFNTVTASSEIQETRIVAPNAIDGNETLNWTEAERSQLGRFDLLEVLGEGAFGKVYRAHDPQLDRDVALKIPRQGALKDEDDLERFWREARAAATLRHPCICPVYEVGELDGRQYIVMAFIDGQPLSTAIAGGKKVQQRHAVNVVRKLALALAEAHRHGVVHRDLKPSNIMIDARGEPVVTDFGLARRIESGDTQLTHTGDIVGTPAYMSPEQAGGRIDEVGPATDIYSLGVILYELLCGRRPFGGRLGELIGAIQHVEPNPPSTHRKSIPPELDAICLKALAKRPDDRYGSMREFASALTSFLNQPSSRSVDSGTSHDSIPVFQDIIVDTQVDPNAQTIRASQADSATLPTTPDTPTELTPTFQARQTLSASLRRHWKWIAYVALASIILSAVGLWSISYWNRSKPKQQRPKVVANSNENRNDQAASEDDITVNAVDSDAVSAEPNLFDLRPLTQENSDSTDSSTGNGTSATIAKGDTQQPIIPAKPKTLIVGTGNGQYTSLESAINDARPGDTIRIMHRGPLEIPPLDLTGKTPLVIEGGQIDGKDFWPIIRQPILPANQRDPAPPPADGLFHTDNLHLTLRKIHLAVGGPNRRNVRGVFAGVGCRITLEDCTVTIGEEGPMNPIGPDVALIQSTGHNGEVRLDIKRTFCRGQRLKQCVLAPEPLSEPGAGVELKAENLIWAGGAAPFLVLQNVEKSCRVEIKQSTIYNVPSLLIWQSPRRQSEGAKPPMQFNLENSIVVGPYANDNLLIDWNADDQDDSLVTAVEAKFLSISSARNLFFRYAGYFQPHDRSRPANIAAWRQACEQNNREMVDEEGDPYFRVWPDGRMLEIAVARDFRPRLWKHTGRGPNNSSAGADDSQMPIAIPGVVGGSLNRTIAHTPRGQPRVLKVNQIDGPFKTLEAAIKAAGDGDIIEITDNGPYVPKRNFNLLPGFGIIELTGIRLTIRAADGVQPIVVLNDQVQEGKINPIESPSYPGSLGSLRLFHLENCSLTVDGVHFRDTVKTNRSAIFEGRPSHFRITNCLFDSVSVGGMFDVQVPWQMWLENCVLAGTETYDCLFVARYAYALVMRNCLVRAGISFLPYRYASYVAFNLHFERNTFLDRQHRFDDTLPNPTILSRFDENLLVNDEPILYVTPLILEKIQPSGARNAVWFGNRPFTNAERKTGGNSLVPGPILPSMPPPEGNSTSRDPYRRFRIHRGRPESRMALDGGPAGVRTEYLPDPSALRPEFFQ